MLHITFNKAEKRKGDEKQRGGDLMNSNVDNMVDYFRNYILDKDNIIHFSDCAVYNEPAYPAGPCDCGAIKARKRWWTYFYHLSRIRYAHLRSVLWSRSGSNR